jgi:WD40 repeat protein
MWIQKVAGAGIDGLAYSPDGRTLYTADGLSRFTAWDVAGRKPDQLTQLRPSERSGLYRLLVSPDGRVLVAVQTGTSVVLPIATGTGWQHYPVSVARPPEARFAPGCGAVLATLTDNGKQMSWWDLPAQGERRTFVPSCPENAPARSFDFSPDGRNIAVLGETGEVTIAENSSGQVLTRFAVPKRGPWLWHIQFSPDGGTLLLFTQHQLVLWDLAQGKVLKEIYDPVPYDATFALNPRFPMFAVAHRSLGLTLFSLESGQLIRSLDFALGHFVQCVCFSPDGLTCAVGGSNKQFAVFDVDL